LWLRYLTGMKLQALHRNHLGVKGRDARREVSLHVGMLPQASSVSLAAHLSGSTPRPVKRRSRGVAASHPGCPELGVA
jgi:hypothetical protein